MSYEVELSHRAFRYLKRLDKSTRKRILRGLRDMEEAPFGGDIAKIRGIKDLYRRRVGIYRIIFAVNSAQRQITIVTILPRSGVYKKL